MQNTWQSSIKELIAENPRVEKILGEYGIECGTCHVGLCRLKDILEIHKLPAADEKNMLTRISYVISNRERDPPPIVAKSFRQPSRIIFSPPFQKLASEHNWIKRWITLIPKIEVVLDLRKVEGRVMVLAGVDFMSNYADKFHHAKEEDILFKCFAENLDILQVMLTEHEQGRNYGRAILDALERKDQKEVLENLRAYKKLLSQHIKKEDEILFPWLERELSNTQLENL